MKYFLILLLGALLHGAMAQAAVTVNFVESGGNVVATANSTVNTAGLTYYATNSPGNSFVGFCVVFTY